MKSPAEVTIIVDQHEVRSGIIDELESLSNHIAHVNVNVQTLPVGDYIISGKHSAVERKTCADFLSSTIDHKGHLFGQLADMARAYKNSILIIEGSREDLYGTRMIDPRTIDGMLATVANTFHTPILWTAGIESTASMLVTLAKQEQIDNHRIPAVHGSRSKMTLPKQQEYFIGAIRDLGPGKAILLLKHFGTAENVVKASMKELMLVDGIGETTAKTIREVITTEYKK